MSLAVLICLVFGLGLVASARHGSTHTASLERLGGLMVVAGLIGLGFLLASRMR